MRQIITFLLILTSFESCRTSNANCSVNKEVEKEFNNCINLLNRKFIRRGLVTDYKMHRAFVFLEGLTGIKSEHTYEWAGVTYRLTGTSYKEERRKWINWYKNNKYGISPARGDSLIKLLHLPYKPATGNEF